MSFYACSREQELTAALQNGSWPAAADLELRAHVDGCRHCGDIVLVTQALQQSRRAVLEAAPAHAPGLLWWKAQLRRRNQAMERVARPLAAVEIVSLLATIIAAGGLVFWRWQDVGEWLHWLSGLSRTPAFHFGAISSGSGPVPLIALAFTAALAVFAALAVYLLAARE